MACATSSSPPASSGCSSAVPSWSGATTASRRPPAGTTTTSSPTVADHAPGGIDVHHEHVHDHCAALDVGLDRPGAEGSARCPSRPASCSTAPRRTAAFSASTSTPASSPFGPWTWATAWAPSTSSGAEQLVVSAPDFQPGVRPVSRLEEREPASWSSTSGSQVLRGPAEDELWVIDSADVQREPNQGSAQRIHLDGTPVGPRLTLPGNVGDDGAGQLILFVPNAAATYALDTATGAPSRLAERLPARARPQPGRRHDVRRAPRVPPAGHESGDRSGPAACPTVATSRLVDYGGGAVISPDGRWLALARRSRPDDGDRPAGRL